MPWFKVDDTLAVHPKMVAAGNRAIGLWVRAGAWSMSTLTDGFVPSSMIGVLGGTRRDADRLVDAGLWSKARGGWQFHEWAAYQPTRVEVEAARRQSRERVRKWRAARAAERDGNDEGEEG